MPDKGMANCFCGAPILLTRNTKNNGAILEHLGDETQRVEIFDSVKGKPMWKMLGWLEDIHGLREKGTGT